MPDDAQDKASSDLSSEGSKSSQRPPRVEQKPWLTTPAPIKRLFDNFPLLTYPSNNLPAQAGISDNEHVLYIFTTPEGARTGCPSFNPSCLKWQVKPSPPFFLSIQPPCTHALTKGIAAGLPQIHEPQIRNRPIHQPRLSERRPPLPRRLQAAARSRVLDDRGADFETRALGAIARGCAERAPEHALRGVHGVAGPSDTARLGMPPPIHTCLSWNSLINQAQLYTLYLIPSNFHSVAERLYIDPTSRNPFVRLALSYQLRQAARAELRKHAPVIDVEGVFMEAEKAWEALSGLLGDDTYFFAQERPGLFDASVFAYTHLLLDGGTAWADTRMQRGLRKWTALVEHRERLLGIYF